MPGRLAVVLLLVSCAPEAPGPHAGAERLLVEPPRLEDLDPAAGRFVGELTASAVSLDLTGETATFLAYNGTVPGPLIRVPQGEEVEIRFHNALPTGEGAGDWASGIHWHGIEGYNASDGTPLTQVATQPGASFTYRFRASRAGIHWYHPHVRGVQGLFSGLYAPLVVEDPGEAELVARGILPSDDRVLVLSDTWVVQGQIASAEVDNAMEVMNGTEGRDVLVNGQVNPVLEVAAGGGVRLRLINASITRFWRLSVPGQTLYRVGGEGGLLDEVRVEGGTVRAERIDLRDGSLRGHAGVSLGHARGEILLAPGERADVVLVADGAPGEEWSLRWEDYARGRHEMWQDGDEVVMGDAADDGLRPGQEVARIRLVPPAEDADTDTEGVFSMAEGDPLLRALGRTAASIPPEAVGVEWLGADATTLEEEMTHALDTGMGTGTGEMVMTSWFGMNGASWHPDHHAGADQPLAPSAKVAQLGETLRWEVRNHSQMAHPFHLHGFSYQPEAIILGAAHLEGEGLRVPVTHTELEDTTLIPAMSSLVFRVALADPAGTGAAAGRWVQHCHILQHGENGMMSELVVLP